MFFLIEVLKIADKPKVFMSGGASDNVYFESVAEPNIHFSLDRNDMTSNTQDSALHHLAIIKNGHQWHFRFTTEDAPAIVAAANQWAANPQSMFDDDDAKRISKHALPSFASINKNEELI